MSGWLAEFKPELLHVDIERLRQSMAGDDPERNEWFKEMVGSSLVEVAWREATGRR